MNSHSLSRRVTVFTYYVVDWQIYIYIYIRPKVLGITQLAFLGEIINKFEDCNIKINIRTLERTPKQQGFDFI